MKLESAISTLESESCSDVDRDLAINAICDCIENQTEASAYIPAGETTTRIQRVLLSLLNRDHSNLPIRKLFWMIGRIEDPALVERYKEWIEDYLVRLKHASGALHQLLMNLDILTDNIRSASLTQIDQNVQRAQDYLDRPIPW